MTQVNAELIVAVEQFLFFEADLLDQGDFRGWLKLLAADVHYWMPLRRVRPPRQRHLEISAENELASFDEGLASLERRIRKLETGKSWAEEPPSRTRHYVTNVRVSLAGELLRVRSNVMVFRGRGESDEQWFSAERFDLLQPCPGEDQPYRIKERKIVLDHTTLLSPNLSFFF